MKNLIYLLILSLTISCTNKVKQPAGGWDVTVSGKVKFPKENAMVQIQELTPADNPKSDSVKVGADGSYSKTMHLTEPGYYRFNFYDLQLVDLVLDKSNIELNVDGNDQAGSVEIKGSPDYDLVRSVQEQLTSFEQQPEVKELQAKYLEAGQKDQRDVVNSIREQYMDLMTAYVDKIVAGLESKPVSLGLINLLEGGTFDDKDRYYSFYQKVADSAMAKMPTSIHVQQFSDMVQKMGITAIGRRAPEIALPNPNGDTVKLSALQGKYVLVDFWAKWCGPCRQENPNVVKAYHEFKSKGFEVFGVSLDRRKDDWVAAIKQDGLVWTQVSDLKYFDSQAALDYNINAIPFSILVDPNGVIIAKNLRGSALHRKLEEVFNKK
jgi:peroxiredoxin